MAVISWLPVEGEQHSVDNAPMAVMAVAGAASGEPVVVAGEECRGLFCRNVLER